MSATTAAKRPASYFSTVSHGRRALDMAVIGGLFVLAMLGFHEVYGGVQYLLTGIMALVLGTLIALIGARWRWGPLRLTPALLVVYFLFGPMFAALTRALWGVLPTPGALWELLKAPVTSWKSVLTVAPPVGVAQGVLAVVWISVLVLSLLGMSIVLRSRFYALAWILPLALIGVTIVFGTDQAFAPVLRGVLYAIISVAWLTWRFEGARLSSAQSTIISDTVRPGSWKNPALRRRVIGGALIMALAGGGAVAAHSLLDPPAGTIRYATRDHISPPFDPRQYVSPLTEFRGYLKDQRDATLFTVSGMSSGEHVRLATMDQWDLQVYNVASSTDKDSASGAFLRTAPGVDLHQGDSAEAVSTVTIGKYRGVWMPTIGSRTNRVDLEGMSGDRSSVTSENLYLNQASQTLVNSRGVQEGDSYELSYEPYPELTKEQRDGEATFSEMTLPDNAPVDAFKQFATEWSGDEKEDSDYERMENLTRALKEDAYFSHGLGEDSASNSGHGASRLLAMMEEEVSFDKDVPDAQPMGRIGDQEQYAALLAVMARSIGIPARVVMGFEVPEGQEGTVAITGENVTAWVEVSFDGIGWVRFDPAPDEDEDPTQPKPKEVEDPLPQVAQPPPPPAEPPSPPPGAMSEDSDDTGKDDQDKTSWVAYVGIGLTPIVLLLFAALAVVLAKRRRRGRRRTRGSLPSRVDGGWQEILDLMADMGRAPDPLLTRTELAARLDADIPAVGAASLAGRADRAVFGPDDLPDAAADEYWAQVMAARRSMSAAVPWHRRLRAMLSLRSFRRLSVDRRSEKKRTRARTRAREKVERRAAALRRRRSSSRGTGTKRTSTKKGPAS
ncbi:cysteine protease [Brachybacterium ginsengisoli]|uniref:Cysteine protease n=1 Tax=Brachybacterium ginsengisoli TaxID=1331682 RepID=A0A291GVV1_9MICO|nr:transglutaminase domain-containing protein [Brachybacterium ginsengisoli]ATG54351.1 cysteine protease [Brachybacterium ginsengisoli]